MLPNISTQLFKYDFATKTSSSVLNPSKYVGGLSYTKNGQYLVDVEGTFSASDKSTVGFTKDAEYSNFMISPSGKHILFSREIKAMQKQKRRFMMI